jgi:hypothetical protein
MESRDTFAKSVSSIAEKIHLLMDIAFVRKTLSFSKSILMHIACLDLFLHRYNLEMAVSF